MNHIGNIIKEFRCLRNMTRNELAEDVCTEKYIYLIERGDRTPSTGLLRMFNDRLRVDLFEYYKFLDCKEPIRVKEIIDELTFCQRQSDFIKAEKLVSTAKDLPDFKMKPWIYIFEANRIACKVFNERRYEEAIGEIKNMIQKLDDEHADSVYVLSLYVLLSTCYQILGSWNDAKGIIFKADDIITKRYNYENYNHIIITARISLLTVHYHLKEFNKAIQIGQELVKLQQSSDSLSRIHYTFAFMAFAYYNTDNYEKAFMYFNKVVYILLTYYIPNDAYFIMSQDGFELMAKDNRMNQQVVNMLIRLYGEKT